MPSDRLPYAADAERYVCTRVIPVVRQALSNSIWSTSTPANTSYSALKPAELQVLRSQYEKEDPYPSLQTKFNYAWGLIKSDKREEQQDGVRLLSEIFRASPERRRECLYYLGKWSVL